MELVLNRKLIISIQHLGMVIENVQLALAWKAGQCLVKDDAEIAEFSPMEKFKALEAQIGANLLNPFGSVAYEDHNDEGEEPTQSQETHTPSETSAFELLDLVDEECAHCNGLSCMIALPDGKHIHKARVLCEFTKYSRESNSMDCLRRVANVSKFAQSALTPSTYAG